MSSLNGISLNKEIFDHMELTLADVRRGVLVHIQDHHVDLERPIRCLDELIGFSTDVGFDDVSDLGGVLLLNLQGLDLRNGGDDLLNRVLDGISKIEEAVFHLRKHGGELAGEIDAFVDDSFDILNLDSVDSWEVPAESERFSETTMEPEADPNEDEFEIDAEMLEVFAMEADDLLKNIEQSLKKLAVNVDDRDALWEIRRNAHTFKGAAGIVGLKSPSKLAHRVEDLLDHMAESEAAPTREVVPLLADATEILRTITSGDAAHHTDLFGNIYQRFDEMMQSLNEPAASQPEAIEPLPVEPIEAVAAELPVLDLTPELRVAVPEISAIPSIVTDDPVGRPATGRSIVRVSLERLDELASIVRDLIISRSVLDQKMTELESRIGELHGTTRRLQSTTNRFEIDLEASLMPAAGGRDASGDALSNTARRVDNGDFDALEFDRYTEFHQCTRELSEATSDNVALAGSLENLKEGLSSLFENQRSMVDILQEKISRIRMVEFGSLATRIQRTVRVTCEEMRKIADVVIENEKLEIDTQILDAIVEPMMHLLKNAVVHGIEPPETRRLLGKSESGRIRLKIINEETHVRLMVSDDGGGISAGALKAKAIASGLLTPERAADLTSQQAYALIFEPGLTTAETLNLSAGRGVGMSIVKESVESRQGTVTVESTPQSGSVFTIRVPLPLAVAKVLIARVDGMNYAIPIKLVTHIASVPEAIDRAHDLSAVDLDIGVFEVFRLSRCLGLAAHDDFRSEYTALTMNVGDKTFAVAVDEILKSEEIVVYPLGRPLDGISGVIGAAMLGNGSVVPILDMPTLLEWSEREAPVAPVREAPANDRTVLVVDDSPSVRLITSKAIEKAGWKARSAKDGLDALELLRECETLPRLVLSDVEMPRMDGYVLLETLKRDDKLKDIPVVFLTSRSGEKHREKAAELGVTDYLSKPFADTELLTILKRLDEETT